MYVSTGRDDSCSVSGLPIEPEPVSPSRIVPIVRAALGLTALVESLPPWDGWLIYSLLRYRSRVDRAVAQLGRRITVGVTGSHVDDRGRRLSFSSLAAHTAVSCWFGSTYGDQVYVRHGPAEAGDSVLLSPRWLSISQLAHAVTPLRASPPPDFPFAYLRLGRWIPSAAAITTAASGFVAQHGGTVEDDWLRLPDAWEPLVRAVDTFDDTTAAAKIQLARAFSDVEIAAPDDADQAGTLRTLHHRWVAGWIERGDEAGLELAEELFTGAELVAACESAIDRHWKLAVSAIHTLARRPDTPISARVRALTPRLRTNANAGLSVLNVAVPYLLARDADVEVMHAKLRAVAATPEVSDHDRLVRRPIWLGLIRCALRWEPAAALVMIRHALRGPSSWHAQQLLGGIVFYSQPWCIRELEAALAEHAPMQAELAFALSRCRRPPDTNPADTPSDWLSRAIAAWERGGGPPPVVPDDLDVSR